MINQQARWHRPLRVPPLPEGRADPLRRSNKDYWNAKDVLVDNLIFAITTDASVRFQKLKAGECHIMSCAQAAGHRRHEGRPQPEDASSARLQHRLPLLQHQAQAADDQAARCARHWTWRSTSKAIIDAIYQGAGSGRGQPLPPSLWSYNETLKDAAYSPEKAKELLKNAGVAEGTEITLWAMPVQRPYNPNAKLMAEMIQADWAKVGIKAKITRTSGASTSSAEGG